MMDSIEKAMFGRSLSSELPSTAVQPNLSKDITKNSDIIERATSVTVAPAIVRTTETTTNKRTQQSITLDMEW
ncbi:MAG: hypothetical protein ABTS22_08915, partial [Accumulibacter sp.]